MSETITALDLFAGTGWGVACKRLGIREMGVEIMPEAIATRDANGMATIYRDVWDGLEGKFHVPAYQLLIASPPCQTFSLAGKGSGRAALNEVLEAIELHAYKDPTQLREFGEKHDPRTALVLAPLAHAWRDRPEYVAFEQVPTVLPVWEACAEVMREWGYSVDVAVLNAEQYGVPQTRKRAILVGRLNGEAKLPTPTHSRYYSTKPEKLDPDVLPWVSMAEALGMADARGSVAKGVQPNSPMRRLTEPAVTLAFGHDAASFVMVPEDIEHADLRRAKADGTAQRLTIDQASALQSYPTVFRNGNQAHAARRTIDQPAPTIHFGARSNKVEWMDAEQAKDPKASGQRVTIEEAAALQSYPTGRGLVDRPSPTITGGGTETGGAEPIAKYHARYTSAPGWVGSTDRLTTDECATLQTYEKPFEWVGPKTKTFLQIGNAVPPLLAQAVLTALVERNA